MKKLGLLTLGVVTLSVLSGCSIIKLISNNVPSSPSPTSGSPSSQSTGIGTGLNKQSTVKTNTDRDLTEKMNTYVDCLNGASKAVFLARDSYLQTVDYKKGPTGKEVVIVFPYYSSAQTCIKNAEAMQTSEPRLDELEKAGATFITLLKKIDPLLVKAHDYYDQKDYQDDQFAKGKEYHAQLVKDWDEFDEADLDLRNQIDLINNEKDIKELAELEKTDGRKIPFLLKNSFLTAKKVLNESNVADLKEVELENLTKAIAESDKAFTELYDYISANPNDENASDASSFVMGSKTFMGSAKNLMRRVRDHKPYDSGELMLMGMATAEWTVEGSPAEVLHTYNELVKDYNSFVRFAH